MKLFPLAQEISRANDVHIFKKSVCYAVTHIARTACASNTIKCIWLCVNNWQVSAYAEQCFQLVMITSMNNIHRVCVCDPPNLSCPKAITSVEIIQQNESSHERLQADSNSPAQLKGCLKDADGLVPRTIEVQGLCLWGCHGAPEWGGCSRFQHRCGRK